MGGVIFLLMLLGAGVAGVWFLRVRLPGWRDSHEWYEPRGAASRVAHLVATFFASIWFAGAVLVRSAAGLVGDEDLARVPGAGEAYAGALRLEADAIEDELARRERAREEGGDAS